eukprot:COSAG05_NODE_1017_length_6171_cov_45.912714_3_plen_206_part_00
MPPSKFRLLAAPVVAILARNSLDLDDPDVVYMVRVFYGGVQSCIVLALLLTAYQIWRKKEATQIGVSSAPGPFEQPGPNKVTRMSIQQYEIDLLKKEALQVAIQNAVAVGLFHLHLGHVTPLILAGIFAPVQLADKPLVKVHLRGAQPKGKLTRPYEGMDDPGQNWMQDYIKAAAKGATERQKEMEAAEKRQNAKAAKKAAKKLR